MRAYSDDFEAISDVLRLSKAMSRKAALAGLPVGGAKSVILGDPSSAKHPGLMQAMGTFVESLGGRYVAAPDSGIDHADLVAMRERTRSVTGVDVEAAPYTARGVMTGIRASLEWARQGDDDLHGTTVAVQGAGNVGSALCALLAEAGAHLIVADIDTRRAEHVARRFNARAVDIREILETEADVFAPCALGGVINDESIPRIAAPIVAGAANNQLARPEHAQALQDRGILFAPDYIINAGGLIAGVSEVDGFDPEAVDEGISRITTTVHEVFALSAAEAITPYDAAERVAAERLRERESS